MHSRPKEPERKIPLEMMNLIFAESPHQIEIVRKLFLAYEASLETDLCFQNFNEELAELPGGYAPPDGRLLYSVQEGRSAGCVAVRKLSGEVCEMKRLYVEPDFRRTGLGRILAEAAIREARGIGYGLIRLDTLPSMSNAQGLYRDLGFYPIAPYNDNPVPGAVFMELVLN